LPTDHAPEISLCHEQFDECLPSMRALGYPYRLGAVRQCFGNNFDDVARAAHDADGSAAAGACSGILETNVRIVSDGLAPAFSQYSRRSRLTSNVSGFVRGLYDPSTSTKLLSRAARESVTTMRKYGRFLEPVRLNRIANINTPST
jgi:hypothetical protein